ncbi:MAG: hypothetical protein EA419_08390 [Wenzhouxiangella sp.]|nr:MAG: hypothetical protein EA419_08390 [Wenzhouxiangella sp.]
MIEAADSPAGADLEQVLATWRDWQLPLQQRPRPIGPVPGGRTNQNHRLVAPGLGHDLLLRLNHPEPQRLGIDRAAERIVLDRVAGHGIGRPALHWDPDERFVVFGYLEARPWTRADMDCAAQRARLWPLIERLADIAPDLPRRRYHAYLCHYWQQLERAGRADRRLQRAWRDFEPRLQAFDQSGWQAGLVHHDLVPANVLDTGDRLVLIDWEYAAIGHPGIDAWSIAPEACREPFIPEMMGWINELWERLVKG